MSPTGSDRPELPPGPYLVVGLARSGQAVARMLAARGYEVVAVDSGSPPGAEGLRGGGVEVLLDGDGVEQLARVRTVVKSPGVPRQAPAIAGAADRGIGVFGELEVAWRALPNRFVAVTGTNGKTTVVEWLGHVLRRAGRDAAVAGNVGTALSSLAGEIGPETTVVAECSSFQLEDTIDFRPEVAVLLNLTPDHLDRHGSFEHYLESKLRIFSNQGPADGSVVDYDERARLDFEVGGSGRRLGYGIEACGAGGAGCEAWFADGWIETGAGPLIAATELALPGEHNLRNAMAVSAAALALGLSGAEIAVGLADFPGVPHRLERVASIDGVTYVNDSKATNVAAAEAAIRSFAGGVRVILGGSLKGGGFAELGAPLAERCPAAYLIGEAAGDLERDLGGAGVELRHSETLERAVADAAADASRGETVLLAPACASFDAFTSFEHRGERFRELVGGLG